MISKFVQIGNKIEIESIKKTTDDLGGEVTRKTYRSELYDIESEDIIKIAMPMEQTKIVLLPVDAEYSLCFYTPNGLYQCLARVVERYKSNNLFVLSMELETDLQKYQRREYYRLNTVLDMKSKALDDGTTPGGFEQVQFIDTDLTVDNGTMVDISGGGARFISKVQYTEGSLIRFVFSLFVNGEVTEYKLIGKVLRSAPMENKEDSFENRIQFVNMVNDDRESIIKYIFEEERKMRHRERGTL